MDSGIHLRSIYLLHDFDVFVDGGDNVMTVINKIKDPDTGIELRQILVTPERALIYLKSNRSNRKVRKTVVAQYADDMANGRWNESVIDPIYISTEGNLLNGQHRLYAIVSSKTPIKMWVAENVSPEAYKYMDGGLKRQAKDMITSPNATHLAGLVRIIVPIIEGHTALLSAMQGKMGTSKKDEHHVSRTQIVDYANEHGDDLQRYISMGRRMHNAIGSGSSVTYCFMPWLVDWLGRGDLIDFFVEDFVGQVPQNANVQLCKAHLSKSIIQGRMTPKSLLSILLTAYDAYLSGKPLKNMQKAEATLQKYDELIAERRKELTK